ncbi:MAG TPA: pyridoxamine 5'-phosphate oxidase family protein [Bacteroidales bacterium]
MIPEKLMEVLKHEGVVAIATQGEKGIHMVNTWNSYLKLTADERIIGPVGGMKTTESNIRQNNNILMTLGSREVQGFHSKGTGFLIHGTATFIYEGDEFNNLKQTYSWARAMLEIKPESITQTL